MENKKSKILIVDDTPQNIKILGEFLRKNYEILIAINGERALKIAIEQKPDLILLDIMMPEIDGYTVCKQLKNNNQTREIPIIFVTAKDQVEDELRGLEFGAIDYITKPFQLEIVKARIRVHLDLKKKYDLLGELAMLDGLTEIPNRRRFDEALEQEWRRNLRASKPLAVIMMDIDFFKLYNDNYGHTMGDDCLKTVAQSIFKTIHRAGDLAARYGGEEFVALLPETNILQAQNLAEKIRVNIESLKIVHEFSPVSKIVTLSLGGAGIIPNADFSALQLIKEADLMLYEAKKNGRNRVSWKEL